jgi:F-type H+-transporting ATPase subunit delta
LAEKTLQAKRYSQAIFEIAKEQQEFDTWLEHLQQIAALAQNSEFSAVMGNPKIPLEEKFKILDLQLKNISPMALNLAYMLVSKDRFDLITDISIAYQQILDEYRGIEKAEVTTAVPLDEKERQKLAERLSHITGKKIIMAVKVDPDILGGMIAKVGEKIIDGSTRSQLDALKKELAGAGG